MLPGLWPQEVKAPYVPGQHQQSAGLNMLDRGKARREVPWTNHTGASAVFLGWAYQNRAMWCSQGLATFRRLRKREGGPPCLHGSTAGLRDERCGCRNQTLRSISHESKAKARTHFWERFERTLLRSGQTMPASLALPPPTPGLHPRGQFLTPPSDSRI